METNTFTLDQVQLPLELIKRNFAPCTVYCFGFRNKTAASGNRILYKNSSKITGIHFDLLIFSNKVHPNGASDIANRIAEQSGKKITATILLHKLTQLATKQTSQQWFFDKIIRSARRLIIDATAPPYLPGNDFPKRDVAADRTYWAKCLTVANFNILTGAENKQSGIELCKIAMLHTAAQQIALGLIRVFLGNFPNEFGLGYLLQLCEHFTALPSEIFPQRTEQDIKRFKRLCAPTSCLQHWTRVNADEQDVQYLQERCQQFLIEADKLVNLELERLETETN